MQNSLSLTRCTETLLGESFFIAATFRFYNFSTDSNQLLATIKLQSFMLCCKHVCDPNLRKTRWCQRKIKLKEFERRTAEIKEPFGKGRHIKLDQSSTRKTLNVFAKKLPLNSLGEALAKLTGNRKPVYSTPLVTQTNRKTFRREGITLRSTITQPHEPRALDYQNYFKARKTTKSIP